MDALELHNHTDARLRCTVLSSGEVVGQVEVLAAENKRQDEGSSSCGLGAHPMTVEPGESDECYRSSWLRPTRFSLGVGVLSDQAISELHARPVRWITATSELYDSSLAAPGARLVLTWQERARDR